MSHKDTIVAIATAPGRGAVGIVRVSGPMTAAIARGILGCLPPPRRAIFLPFHDAGGVALDEGLALWFPAPRSYTGEDVLELQGHGGPVVLDQVIERAVALGARPARPGEFSERAFLNGRLDLAQAEAVADLIDAASTQAARAALRSLQGEFSHRVGMLVVALTELRVYVEAAIDFPDEELDLLADGEVVRRLADLQTQLATLLSEARQGALLREGITVVIAGRPNVGKSSLLNRLARREAAIVTDIPGTTRDVLREAIHLDGMPLHIIDTAGLRATDDPVEREGVRRAYAEMERADRILLVVDDTVGFGPEEQTILSQLSVGSAGPALTIVRNKADLSGRTTGLAGGPLGPEVALSAVTGAGLSALTSHLKVVVGYPSVDAGNFSARRRHLDALRQTQLHLAMAAGNLAISALELLAEELRLAQETLGEITGAVTADDLLGQIFGSFCIGK
ncbi:5-carboxymethylaminomethyluridine-tRNA synthase GTPase subunit [Gammaproteobacteria bacterium]